MNRKQTVSSNNEPFVSNKYREHMTTTDIIDNGIKENTSTPNLTGEQTRPEDISQGNWEDQFNYASVNNPVNVVPNLDTTTGSLAGFDTSINTSSNITNEEVDKIINEQTQKQLSFNNTDLLPQEVNKDWFESDFSNARIKIGNDNLINTDRYMVGINTVGQSLKNPSYDLRPSPPCPKVTVSPWNNSTVEPDFNIKPWY